MDHILKEKERARKDNAVTYNGQENKGLEM